MKNKVRNIIGCILTGTFFAMFLVSANYFSYTSTTTPITDFMGASYIIGLFGAPIIATIFFIGGKKQ